MLKMYMEYDMALYDRCSSDYLRLEEEKKRKAQDAERRYEHTHTHAHREKDSHACIKKEADPRGLVDQRSTGWSSSVWLCPSHALCCLNV